MLPNPQANPPSGRPWPRIPQNIGYDPPLNAIAGWFSAACEVSSRYDGACGGQAEPGATSLVGRGWATPGTQRGLPERLRLFVAKGDPAGSPGLATASADRTRTANCPADS